MRGHSYYQLCGRQVSCAECTCTSFRWTPSRFLVAAMQQCQADHASGLWVLPYPTWVGVVLHMEEEEEEEEEGYDVDKV